MSTTRELTTKDDVPLRELLDESLQVVDYFNEEATFPFRDLFVEEVDQQTFKQFPQGEFDWEELAEGEHPRTAEMDDPKTIAFSVAKFGRALGFTQEFFEDHTSERVQRRMEKLIAGATELQRTHIMDVIDNGIADGRDLWYDVDDYGGYEFENDHNHWFDDTDALAGDADDGYSDGTEIRASKHIELGMDHLRHHGKGNQVVALVGAPFKRKLRNEITWNLDHHIPEAQNLRTSDLWTSDVPDVDGARIMQTPWLTGSEFYLVDTSTENPVKMHEKRPVQLTRAQGGQVQKPGELLGASGTGRWGFKFVDPLDALYVNADNIEEE